MKTSCALNHNTKPWDLFGGHPNLDRSWRMLGRDIELGRTDRYLESYHWADMDSVPRLEVGRLIDIDTDIAIIEKTETDTDIDFQKNRKKIDTNIDLKNRHRPSSNLDWQPVEICKNCIWLARARTRCYFWN